MSLEPGAVPKPPAETAQEDLEPGGGPQPCGAAPESAGQVAPAPLPQHRIGRTRISGVWFALGSFAVVLLFLLIFILQNSNTVEVSYLGAHGRLPLGVALLMAVIGGVLLTALIGAARIIQLRATARRHRRADARNATARREAAGSGPLAEDSPAG